MREKIKYALLFLASLFLLAVGSAVLYGILAGISFLVLYYIISIDFWPSIIFSMLTGLALIWLLEDAFSLFSRFHGKKKTNRAGN